MIEKSKLISKISQKAKITSAKAKIAYECVLKESPAFRNQSIKKVQVKKEVLVKVAGKTKVEKVKLKEQVASKAKDIVEKVKIVEVIKEVPVEVIKEIKVITPVEVIKEVPVTVVKEVVKEVEIIKEVPIEVLKEITLVNEVYKKDDTALNKLKAELTQLRKSYKNLESKYAKELKSWKKKLDQKPKVVEVVKEVEVEVIKEVEVVKSFDMAMLQKMMKGMKTVEVSKTVVGESRTIGEGKVVERRELKPGSPKTKVTGSITKKANKFKTKSSPKSKGKVSKDDLTKIEGIGPAINKLLNADGIYTFKDLAKAKEKRLKKILENGGSRFQMHNPGSWPKQSKLAAAGNWDDLKKLQDKLNGGK